MSDDLLLPEWRPELEKKGPVSLIHIAIMYAPKQFLQIQLAAYKHSLWMETVGSVSNKKSQ